MTVIEASYQYGFHIYEASIDDNLQKVAYLLYKSEDQKYQDILIQLNQRYDWDNITPGAQIKYIPSNVADSLW